MSGNKKSERKNRRSSILKPTQVTDVPVEDVIARSTIKRRVSFHNLKTVQEYNKQNLVLECSPQKQKIEDTMGSDGIFTPGRSNSLMSIASSECSSAARNDKSSHHEDTRMQTLTMSASRVQEGDRTTYTEVDMAVSIMTRTYQTDRSITDNPVAGMSPCAATPTGQLHTSSVSPSENDDTMALFRTGDNPGAGMTPYTATSTGQFHTPNVSPSENDDTMALFRTGGMTPRAAASTSDKQFHTSNVSSSENDGTMGLFQRGDSDKYEAGMTPLAAGATGHCPTSNVSPSESDDTLALFGTRETVTVPVSATGMNNTNYSEQEMSVCANDTVNTSAMQIDMSVCQTTSDGRSSSPLSSDDTRILFTNAQVKMRDLEMRSPDSMDITRNCTLSQDRDDTMAQLFGPATSGTHVRSEQSNLNDTAMNYENGTMASFDHRPAAGKDMSLLVQTALSDTATNYENDTMALFDKRPATGKDISLLVQTALDGTFSQDTDSTRAHLVEQRTTGGKEKCQMDQINMAEESMDMDLTNFVNTTQASVHKESAAPVGCKLGTTIDLVTDEAEVSHQMNRLVPKFDGTINLITEEMEHSMVIASDEAAQSVSLKETTIPSVNDQMPESSTNNETNCSRSVLLEKSHLKSPGVVMKKKSRMNGDTWNKSRDLQIEEVRRDMNTTADLTAGYDNRTLPNAKDTIMLDAVNEDHLHTVSLIGKHTERRMTSDSSTASSLVAPQEFSTLKNTSQNKTLQVTMDTETIRSRRSRSRRSLTSATLMSELHETTVNSSLLSRTSDRSMIHNVSKPLLTKEADESLTEMLTRVTERLRFGDDSRKVEYVERVEGEEFSNVLRDIGRHRLDMALSEQKSVSLTELNDDADFAEAVLKMNPRKLDVMKRDKWEAAKNRAMSELFAKRGELARSFLDEVQSKKEKMCMELNTAKEESYLCQNLERLEDEVRIGQEEVEQLERHNNAHSRLRKLDAEKERLADELAQLQLRAQTKAIECMRADLEANKRTYLEIEKESQWMLELARHQRSNQNRVLQLVREVRTGDEISKEDSTMSTSTNGQSSDVVLESGVERDC